jgi:hypothetical protein
VSKFDDLDQFVDGDFGWFWSVDVEDHGKRMSSVSSIIKAGLEDLEFWIIYLGIFGNNSILFAFYRDGPQYNIHTI